MIFIRSSTEKRYHNKTDEAIVVVRLEDMEKGIDALEKSNIKILTDDDIKEI